MPWFYNQRRRASSNVSPPCQRPRPQSSRSRDCACSRSRADLRGISWSSLTGSRASGARRARRISARSPFRVYQMPQGPACWDFSPSNLRGDAVRSGGQFYESRRFAPNPLDRQFPMLIEIHGDSIVALLSASVIIVRTE